jgi:AmiR/NasT family two-component response regulator
MDHEHSHPTVPEQGVSPDQTARRVPIRDAVLLIQHRHGISEMSAYAILVQRSADSRSSVREMAARVVEGSA